MEQTLILLKPDCVKRGIVGEIITRFEKAGFKIIGMKMIRAPRELLARHYPSHDEKFLSTIGGKTLETYGKYNLDAKKELGTDSPLEIGKMAMEWILKFMTSGPVIAMVLEGKHAIENARMMAGSTMPIAAAPGTIRGDYSSDSAYYANSEKRMVMNLIHASGTREESEFEIALWFQPEELYFYKRIEEYLTE